MHIHIHIHGRPVKAKGVYAGKRATDFVRSFFKRARKPTGPERRRTSR